MESTPKHQDRCSVIRDRKRNGEDDCPGRSVLLANDHNPSSGPSASTNTNGNPLCEIIRFSSSMLAPVVTHGTDDAGPPKFPSPIAKVRFSSSVKDAIRTKP